MSTIGRIQYQLPPLARQELRELIEAWRDAADGYSIDDVEDAGNALVYAVEALLETTFVDTSEDAP